MEPMITGWGGGGHGKAPPHLAGPRGWLFPLETGMPPSPASRPHGCSNESRVNRTFP